MLMEINSEGEIKKFQGELIMIVSLKEEPSEEAKSPKSRKLSGVPSLYHDSFNRKRTRK